MNTAEIQYLGELRTSSVHILSGEKVVTDAPPDNQGKGAFFSPTDLVASALGSCMLTIMGIAARTHQIHIDNTRVEVRKIMASDPRRVAEIQLDFTCLKLNTPKSKREYWKMQHCTARLRKAYTLI